MPGGRMISIDERPAQQAAGSGRGREELTIVEQVVSPEQLGEALRRRRAVSTLKLGGRLMELGLITRDELEAGLQIKEREPGKHLGEILLDLGLISASHLQQVLCEKLGIPLVDLDQFAYDRSVFALLPEELVRETRVLPLCRIEGNKLVVATADPLDPEALDRIRFVVQMQVVPAFAPREKIEQAIAGRHGHGVSAETTTPGLAEWTMGGGRSDVAEAADISVVRVVNRILAEGCATGATDIHIDSSLGPEHVAVRFRREGRLCEQMRLPAHLRQGIVARLKTLAGIDIAERRQPHEGRIDVLEHVADGVRVRVLTVPTRDGSEDVAIKLVPAHDLPPLEKLGMPDPVLDTLKQFISRPQGLTLVAAPAGNGKTTTAHALVGLLDAAGMKIWTAESPVEIRRPGLSQVEVLEKEGWTYAATVRTIVEADPDVLLVGEVRDRETAAVSIDASLRGCRVLATVRANNATEGIARLLDMGIDAFGLSDALLGVVGQRLVRRLCEQCRSRRTLTPAEIDALVAEYCQGTQLSPSRVRDEWSARFGDELSTHHAGECDACSGTGFDGRIGLYELLLCGPAVRSALVGRRPVGELAAALVGSHRTLAQDGIEKVLAGQCELEEVRAAIA
jgi:type II secretory ATPase GspE/PulE/Tfp pilus assembly ATPase PilB-like protein